MIEQNVIPLTFFTKLFGRQVYLTMKDGSKRLEQIEGIETGKIITWPGHWFNEIDQADIVEVRNINGDILATIQEDNA